MGQGRGAFSGADRFRQGRGNESYTVATVVLHRSLIHFSSRPGTGQTCFCPFFSSFLDQHHGEYIAVVTG